ncbi:cytochrome P450 704C1-like, partial [Solanum tuberosum]
GGYNYYILKDLLGDGIFTVDGDKWREQRKLSSHDFSTRVLRDFSSVVFRKNAAKFAHILTEAVKSNKIVDIQDLFMKASLDSIFRVAFGVELDSMCGSNEEGKKFSDAFDDASALTVRRYVDILWKIKRSLNIGLESKLKENIRTVDVFIHKMIQRKTEEMSKPEADLSLQWKREDILSRFLQITDTDP